MKDKEALSLYLTKERVSFILREDLSTEYKKRVADKTTPLLDDSEILGETIIVCKEQYPHIGEGYNGKSILTEGEITRKDQIKIYTHSKEEAEHNIPHVHVSYGDCKNYCVISLIDFSVLRPKKYNQQKVNKAIDIIKKHYEECKIAWNKTDSRIKI